MVAPGWQNKKKKTLKTRDSRNFKALKTAKMGKMKHDDAKRRVAGKARTGKARRMAVRDERRKARNAKDDEAKKGSGDVAMTNA